VRFVALLVLAALLCQSCFAEGKPASPSTGVGLQIFPASERLPAPELSGSTIAGQHLVLADRLGQGLVAINVWASWCGPCRKEMPLLAKAAGTSLRVIGIDERDDAKAARAFSTSRGATYPSLSDPDGKLLAQMRMLPQTAVPSTLVLDRRGRVAGRVVGAVDDEILQQIIQRLGDST
jgi:thiol-disulfide isomerase/thioredoxin